jgi:hypothetical protein
VRISTTALLAVAAVAGAAATAHAEPTARRKHGTRLVQAGTLALMAGAASEGTAAGLSDHPGPQQGFFAAGLAIGGIGAVLLASGLYLRETSPAEAPDAIARDPVRRRRRWERRVGLSILGAGALVSAVGMAHVVGAVHDHDLADNLCPGGACDADAQRLVARSHTLALASLLLLGPGIVAMAGGAALYVGSPDPDAGVAIVPVATPDQLGAAIVGRF